MLWRTSLVVIVVEGNHGYAKLWIFVFLEIGQCSEEHQHLSSDPKVIVVTGKHFKLVIPFIDSECFGKICQKNWKKMYLHFLYRLIHQGVSTMVSNIIKSCWAALNLNKNYSEIAWVISDFFLLKWQSNLFMVKHLGTDGMYLLLPVNLLLRD